MVTFQFLRRLAPTPPMTSASRGAQSRLARRRRRAIAAGRHENWGDVMLHWEGPVRRAVNYGGLSLQGLTEAHYKHSYSAAGVKITPASGCEQCGNGDKCVHAAGKLRSNFSVKTTVTLPKVSDYPDLTPCQKSRVQSAITSQLAPHEQQHVAKFQAYNGAVTQAVDMTLCQGEFNDRMRELHDAVEGPRQAEVQAASDALDPFSVDVDLDCEEPPAKKPK